MHVTYGGSRSRDRGRHQFCRRRCRGRRRSRRFRFLRSGSAVVGVFRQMNGGRPIHRRGSRVPAAANARGRGAFRRDVPDGCFGGNRAETVNVGSAVFGDRGICGVTMTLNRVRGCGDRGSGRIRRSGCVKRTPSVCNRGRLGVGVCIDHRVPLVGGEFRGRDGGHVSGGSEVKGHRHRRKYREIRGKRAFRGRRRPKRGCERPGTFVRARQASRCRRLFGFFGNDRGSGAGRRRLFFGSAADVV